MAVSYTRPFMGSAEYGPLPGKWSRFPHRPMLAKHHHRLLELRNGLLAHNDRSANRSVAVFPYWGPGGEPGVTEERSPIKARGVQNVRHLFLFQEERFTEAATELATRLQEQLGWSDVVDAEEELRRMKDQASEGAPDETAPDPEELVEQLILASQDMDQATAAIRALEQEPPNTPLSRALETAIAVSYMRPFTESSLGTLPANYVPTNPPDSIRHADMHWLRDKLYAHTDKEGGRGGSVQFLGVEEGRLNFMGQEESPTISRAAIPELADFFDRRRKEFLRDAGLLQAFGRAMGAEPPNEPAS